MKDQDEISTKQERKKVGISLKPWHLIVIILLVLTLIAGGVFMGINWNNWFGDKTPVAVIDAGAMDWDDSKLPNNDKDTTPNKEKGKGIVIPGYPYIELPKDTKNVQVVLLNPKGNPCYFTFEIVLKDTDETIYTSKHVPPGKAVTDLTLSKALSEGSYKATIKITTNSLSDMSPMNGANLETELIVK